MTTNIPKATTFQKKSPQTRDSFWHSLKHYMKVYAGFVSTCLGQATSFRLHFVLLILVDIFFYFSSLASVDLIFNHVQHIGPWDRYQLLFFISVMLGIDQWHMTIISESFWVLSHLIRTGMMDYILIKPIGSLFIVCFRNLRPASALNMIITWSFIIYFGLKINLPLFDFILLPFLMLLGLALLIQIEVILSCSMFWMLEGVGINFLRMELQRVGRWPDFIYGKWGRRIFLIFIPVLLVGNAPVRFLLNREWGFLGGLLSANLVMFFILKFLWPYSLRAYESASS